MRTFTEAPLALSAGKGRTASLVRLAPGEPAGHRTGALALVLAGRLGDAGPGDSRVLAPGENAVALSETLLYLESDAGREGPSRLVRAEGPHGTPFPGLAGLRCLDRGESLVVLRLGPPPGARWLLTGLHAVAVFTGDIEAHTGEDVHVARAGQLLVVKDPRATVPLLSGRDSARAFAVASAGVTARLG